MLTVNRTYKFIFFSRRRRSDHYGSYQADSYDVDYGADCEDLKIKRYNAAVDDGYKLLLDNSRSKRIYFLSDRIFDSRLYADIGDAHNLMKMKIKEKLEGPTR